jgi:hypothetical protein
MKIFTTTRRMTSTEQVTVALDELAHEYGICGGCYDESAAQRMTEFDALKWVTLCSQRSALEQRQAEDRFRDWEVPARFLGIYGTKDHSEPVRLENSDESRIELAA